jgi:UDP-N-acetylmuramyl pentapeptide phosphotransferase/UDP-N-acetylglucosamine-1-phosphate transferase
LKKNKTLIATRIIGVIIIAGTIITLYLVYNNSDNRYAYRFTVGYLALICLASIYFLVTTMINIRKLERGRARKLLLKFISLFVLFGMLNYLFDYFFRPGNYDLLRNFSTALGISFAISFTEVIFYKNRE